MSQLSDRMRKARQSEFEIDGFTFTVLRPTLYEMVKFKEQGMSPYELAKEFVVDWSGVKDVDVIRGGSTEEIPFDKEAWNAWLDEKATWWNPLGMYIIKIFNEHMERTEGEVKN